MRILFKYSISLVLLIIIFTGLFFIFKGRITTFLSFNEKPQADYLIVEGWLSPNSLNQAAEEFKQNEYKKIITTGVPLEPWFLMSTNAYLEFTFPGNKSRIQKGDTIAISLRGTDVKGIYAEYSLYINDSLVQKKYTSEAWKEYTYVIRKDRRLDNIMVSFNNDYFFGEEDRNLYIGKLRVRDSMVAVRSKNSYYYTSINKSDSINMNYHSVAALAARELISGGILENQIVILPASEKARNRTFNSAMAVRNWFDSSRIKPVPVNVFTENIHARRTHLLYSKALGLEREETGVISVTGNSGDTRQNNKITNKNIISELTGYLYYRFLFNSDKYQK